MAGYRGSNQSKGIFCIEGVWWPEQKRPDSIEPLFKLLESSKGYRARSTPYSHWRAPERSTLEMRLTQWAMKKYHDYPILYLAFHGNPGNIELGDARRKESIADLDWLADVLEDKCRGRIIHFASCSTLKVDRRLLNRFLKRTQALAVSGFREKVYWFEASALEIIYLSTLQRWTFTTHGLRRVHKDVSSYARTLCRNLGFNIVIRGNG